MRETTQVKEVGTRSGEEPQEEAKRIDLSVPQVAGSAVARSRAPSPPPSSVSTAPSSAPA